MLEATSTIKKITASILDRSFFKKIIYRIKYLLTIFLIRCSLYAHSPRLTAIILSTVAGKINGAGDYIVLCIGRTIFLDDVKAMARFSGRIRYAVIHKVFFGIVFSHFVAASERKKINENNYHTHPYGAEGKLRYRRFLLALLPRLQAVVGFDALLSGNFAYIEQEEIASACEALHIPFLVLHKEAFDIDRDFANKYRGCVFIGAKMLLYNHRVKEALLHSEAHVGGVSKRVLEVVGVPRLDAYFSIQNNEVVEPQIVFFSFYPQDYFPYAESGDGEKIKQAWARADDFHSWVIDFALRHPDMRVVIKTKFADHYVRYVKDILENSFTRHIPNLFITNSASPVELIQHSAVVIGYSSMALIEAVIANRVVVSPYFADVADDDGLERFFQNYPECIRAVRTKQEFDEAAASFTRRSFLDPEKKKAFLEELIFTPDGRASKRAENAIIKTIKEFQNEK